MTRFVLVGLLCLAGCSNQTSNSVTEYKLVEDGLAETQNERSYASLGEKTFSRVQKYRLVADGDGAKKFHFVIAKVTKMIGKKKITEVDAATLPVVDGAAKIDCDHYYNVKIGENVDKLDDPVCKVELLGTLTPNGTAKLLK